MYSIYFSYTEIYILLFLCHPPELSQYKSFSDSMIIVMAAWDKSGKEKKGKEGKEGKRENIFPKSLFLKISPNIKPHKIPVLSPDLPDLEELPGICSRS